MAKDVNNLLLSFLHLALVKKIFNDEKSPEEHFEIVGKEIGQRVSDDFYAKNHLYTSVPENRVNEYIILFFKEYFGAKIIIHSNTIILNEMFSQYSGIEIFVAVLNEVFPKLNSRYHFSKGDAGKIEIAISK